MKLKYININGYGVLVDERVEINIGQWYFDSTDTISSLPIYQRSQTKKKIIKDVILFYLQKKNSILMYLYCLIGGSWKLSS